MSERDQLRRDTSALWWLLRFASKNSGPWEDDEGFLPNADEAPSIIAKLSAFPKMRAALERNGHGSHCAIMAGMACDCGIPEATALAEAAERGEIPE